MESALEEASILSLPVSDDPEQYLKLHRDFVNLYKNLLMSGRLQVDNREHYELLGALKKGAYEEDSELLRKHIRKRLQDPSKMKL